MPVVIYGSRSITGVKQKGVFHCPHCATQVNYAWKQVRRWSHIYYIPIVAREVLGEYVECQACMKTYKPTVLDYDPAAATRAFEAAYASGVRRVMVQMMLTDGKIDAAEVQLIRGVFLNVTGRALDDAELNAEIESARRGPVDLAAAVRELAGMLNDQGRAAVFKAAYLVAVANGTIDRAEAEQLHRLSMALGLTADQQRKCVEEINRPRSR
jgi:tellurite resistance protein